jgi:two-component system nitrogen regulation response regulator GlnG
MPTSTKDPRSVLICESAAMRALSAEIEKAAADARPVLITGEAGTGRELVARMIHARSARRQQPLVTVAADATLRAVAGGDEGASMDAFVRARRGSLVIKDVGELSRIAQRTLSRVLGDEPTAGAADSRILATANPGLDRLAQAAMWNRTLYQRLSSWHLAVPPLRERQADIAPLCDRYLVQYCRELGRVKLTVGDRAAARLVAYCWPGNVGELKHVARQLAIGVRGRTVSDGDVEAVLPATAARVADPMSLEEMVRTRLGDFLRRVEGYAVTGVHDEIMGQVERPLISLVLAHAGGNQVRAAEILGLSRNTLRKKLADHGLLDGRAPAAKARGGAAD